MVIRALARQKLHTTLKSYRHINHSATQLHPMIKRCGSEISCKNRRAAWPAEVFGKWHKELSLVLTCLWHKIANERSTKYVKVKRYCAVAIFLCFFATKCDRSSNNMLESLETKTRSGLQRVDIIQVKYSNWGLQQVQDFWKGGICSAEECISLPQLGIESKKNHQLLQFLFFSLPTLLTHYFL